MRTSSAANSAEQNCLRCLANPYRGVPCECTTAGTILHYAPVGSGSSSNSVSTAATLAPSANTSTGQPQPAPQLRHPVWWFGPFWSGTGYSSEAINFVLSMLRSSNYRPPDLWVTHHGDMWRSHVVDSMARQDRLALESVQAKESKDKHAIVVCHSLPISWRLPKPMFWSDKPCPPEDHQHQRAYLIGRTMFETDRLPKVFVPRCNAMDEVWVPSDFSKHAFIKSGVRAEKIRVVPEGVNTSYFDPAMHTEIKLPMGELVFGRGRQQQQHSNTTAAGAAHGSSSRPFVFMSTFKWEVRKGWDVLLEAYLTEFTDSDAVELYILTKPFMSGGNFKQRMQEWAVKAMAGKVAMKDGHVDTERLPTVYVVHHHLSDADFPRFYKASGAFVLPSRGEGWGRPHVEAMSMGIPVIATNWSGITAYLDESVGYPLAVDGLVDANDRSVWFFKGLRWAAPSTSHLKQLMRRVVTNRAEAASKGAAARQRMIDRYSPEVLARTLMEEFQRIDAKLLQNSTTQQPS